MSVHLKHLSVLGWLLCGLLISQVQAKSLPEFTSLVDQYGPTVVNISTTARKMSGQGENGSKMPPGIPEDSPLNEFFRHFFDNPNEFFQERPSTSLGSGFIISADGYIVTNNHVIEEASEIIVRLSDRREFVAELIGADKRSDLAVLKVEADDLPVVKLGTSKNLRVGEWVLAIGSPFGFEHSATAGIVSAKGRSLPSDTYVPFIQTDVAINPGNSGGPLFNMDGEVVGVNSQIYSRTGGFMGLSFAIPVDVMNNVVEQLKANGKVARGWLGVLIQDVTRELAESFDMDKPQGALVAKVLPGSPAEAAGFQVGDIILTFNDHDIERSSELPPVVGLTKIGNTVTTKVLRNQEEVSLTVTVAELPSDEDIQLAVSGGSQRAVSNRLGMSVSDLDEQMREELNIPENGVLVDRLESGPARDAGIQENDIVMMINGQAVRDVEHFKALVSDLTVNRAVPILIHRRGSPLFLALKIPEQE